MKVLQVYKDYCPPVKGGIEGHINLLSRGLAKRGIEVEVLVSNTGPRKTTASDNGIAIISVPEFGRLASAPVNPTLPFWLKRLARDADVVHFHFPNPTAELSYLLCRSNGRIVVTYHSDIVRQARLGACYRPLLRRFLQRAGAIIATSESYLQSSRILGRFQDKCTVIPLGIDLDRFRFRPQQAAEIDAVRARYGPDIVLFIGRFRHYKGLHLLIRAMTRVEGTLLLIGTGPLEQDLRWLVRSLKVEGRVVFLGELSDDEVDVYLHASDLLVLPSILRSEAFGVVLLEAMACGKPVVSTELGTGTSFVNRHGETGLVVPPNDPVALERAISFLLANPETRINLGRAGRMRVERDFSWDTMVERVLAVYRRG
jgi:rhamnosyl/mannosyltransferase